jgi:uncharacterized protein with PIN domain
VAGSRALAGTYVLDVVEDRPETIDSNPAGCQARHRLEVGYREKFRTLLAKVRPRRLDFGADLLVRRAREMRIREGIPLGRALARVYEATRVRVEKRLALTVACSLSGLPLGQEPAAARFVCDASLGGLARWLRAAGYEAEWAEKGGADELLRRARAGGGRPAHDRQSDDGADRDPGRIGPAQWLPSDLPRIAQLKMLMRDLGLRPRAPRCMSCGGELRAVAKDEVADRIPPRTARWKDEYYLCAGCGKLFWEGTHWERITRQLGDLVPRPT